MPTVRATETFAAESDGSYIGVKENDPYDSGHFLVKRYPEKFRADEPARRVGRPPKVEQATAAPGEVRDLP